MKKFLWIPAVILALFGISQLCVSIAEENKRLHDEFVARVDYLKPDTITYHISGKTVTQEYRPTTYNELGNVEEYGQPELVRYWSYNLVLDPVTADQALAGNCQSNKDGQPGCTWDYYVWNAYLNKERVSYVISLPWQSGTGFNPEQWAIGQGFDIVRSQYFHTTQTNLANNPELHSIVDDINEAMALWTSAVNERDGHTVIKIKW